MSISAKKRTQWNSLSVEDRDRVVRMAWEDRSTFEAIQKQFDLSANEVVRFMRTQLEPKGFKRWRRRATEQGKLKHERTRPAEVDRFKSSRQRQDGTTKGWK